MSCIPLWESARRSDLDRLWHQREMIHAGEKEEFSLPIYQWLASASVAPQLSSLTHNEWISAKAIHLLKPDVAAVWQGD